MPWILEQLTPYSFREFRLAEGIAEKLNAAEQRGADKVDFHILPVGDILVSAHYPNGTPLPQECVPRPNDVPPTDKPPEDEDDLGPAKPPEPKSKGQTYRKKP